MIEKDLKIMFLRIGTFNLIIGIIFFSIVQLIFKQFYGLCFLLGLIIATINLVINIIGTNLVLIENKNSIFSILGFFIRIAIVCFIAILISKENMINIIPFLLGYSSNFISIILYGISLGRNKV